MIRGGKLYVGEDSLVYWGDRDIVNSGLYNAKTRSYVNDATVTYQLYESNGTTAVSGASGTFDYVTGTEGVYEGVLEDSVALTAGTEYVLEIVATLSSDRIGRRRITYTAEHHGAE